MRTLTKDSMSPPMVGKVERVERTAASNRLLQGRVEQLEKNMLFLTQQHRETLGKLHEEMERLKMVNRGNNYMQASINFLLIFLKKYLKIFLKLI